LLFASAPRIAAPAITAAAVAASLLLLLLAVGPPVDGCPSRR
jgi:hypothetical protein